MALAKPLIITVLIPLLIGAVIKTYAEKMADTVFKPVKLLANLSTALTILFCFLLYSQQMIDTAGSFALLSMTIFMVVMALATYKFGFGLKQNERSVMSLGMGTRNIAAVFAGVLAIPNGDPRLMAMTIMYTLVVLYPCIDCFPYVWQTSRESICSGIKQNNIKKSLKTTPWNQWK